MRDDALPLRRVVLVGAAIVLAVATAIGVALAILHAHRLPFGGVRVGAPARLPADLPMLQTAPQPDLAAYRAEKSRELHRLAWADAASGVAIVPIEAAMALRVARAASAASGLAP